MSAFVLDASVALTWLLGDGTEPIAERALDRLRDHTASVPAIWELEVANGLLVAERAKRCTVARSTRFLELLTSLPIEKDASGELEGVVPLARKAGISAYDASYLELALRRGVSLATLDKRLRAAAESLGLGCV